MHAARDTGRSHLCVEVAKHGLWGAAFRHTFFLFDSTLGPFEPRALHCGQGARYGKPLPKTNSVGTLRTRGLLEHFRFDNHCQ